MEKNWWKEAIIYQIYPRSFKDTTGSGMGDLRGIIEKLDYIGDLGVDTVWLNPIYPSPNDDNGYDVSDYYGIHPEFGTMADFEELLEGLHSRGIYLLMDLVLNHSSDEHPWFIESKKSRDNPFRDFYFWRDGKNGGPPNNWRSFFGGSVWEYDENTDQYYLHLFSKKQPDLNWENSLVREEIKKIILYWLKKGVDGFRMDVITSISKHLGFPDAHLDDFGQIVEKYYANGPRVHEYLQELNKEVLSEYRCFTVGEGPGVTPENANLYVGSDRKELDMIFHLEHMSIDHGPGGRFDPIDYSFKDFKQIFVEWDEAIGDRGWINIFLDNHDFPRMVSRFGDDGQYHKQSAKLLAVTLLTLRGTPCIYFGSEIGMTNVRFESIDQYQDVEMHGKYREYVEAGGDPAVFLGFVHSQGRDNVRTPMQWDRSKHSGFSEADPWLTVNPNFPQINVEEDLASPDSILKFYRKVIDFRKDHPEFVYGNFIHLDGDHPRLFIYRRELEGISRLVILNFSSEDIDVSDWTEPEAEPLICNYASYRSNVIQPWEARIY